MRVGRDLWGLVVRRNGYAMLVKWRRSNPPVADQCRIRPIFALEKSEYQNFFFLWQIIIYQCGEDAELCTERMWPPSESGSAARRSDILADINDFAGGVSACNFPPEPSYIVIAIK